MTPVEQLVSDMLKDMARINWLAQQALEQGALLPGQDFREEIDLRMEKQK